MISFRFLVIYCSLLFNPSVGVGATCVDAFFSDNELLSPTDNNSTRAMSSQIDPKLLKADLLMISGVAHLEGTDISLKARYSEEEKQTFRKFVVRRAKSLGLKSKVQKYKINDGFLPPIDLSTKEDKVDLSSMSEAELKELWESHSLEDFKRWYFAYYGEKEKPKSYKKLRNFSYSYISDLYSEFLDIANHFEVLETFGLKRMYYYWDTEENDLIVVASEKDLEAAHMAGITDKERSGIFEKPMFIKEDFEFLLNILPRDISKNNKTKNKEDYGSYAHNIIVTIPGSKFPDQIIEVSAHYDTVFAHVPGADDNGSGVISLLEMMRIFSDTKPDKTIRFVFTDLEESGMHGAEHHAKSIIEKEENVQAVLVLDMIGYARIGTDYPSKPSFVVEVGDRNHHDRKSFDNDFDPVVAYRQSAKIGQVLHYEFQKYNDRKVDLKLEFDGALPDSTDLGMYWEQNIPAVLISTIYDDDHITPGYHAANDDYHNYNFAFFQDILSLTVESVVTMSGVNGADFSSDVSRLHSQLSARPNLVTNEMKDVKQLIEKHSKVPKKKPRKKSFLWGSPW